MYKAKIFKINKDRTFLISIPSLGLNEVTAYAITHKAGEIGYKEGDLVIVSETNDPTWVILGMVY